MEITDYSFKPLTQEESTQQHECQRPYCEVPSTWKATIPVKRYNGFARNIFLCERHKAKLEKKVGRNSAAVGLTPGPVISEDRVPTSTMGSHDQFGELDELE